MLYQFLVLWLAGILILGWLAYRTHNPVFVATTGIVSTILGYLVYFEGIGFQSIVLVNNVPTRIVSTVFDSATLFMGWASFGLGLILITISIYYIFSEIYRGYVLTRGWYNKRIQLRGVKK